MDKQFLDKVQQKRVDKLALDSAKRQAGVLKSIAESSQKTVNKLDANTAGIASLKQALDKQAKAREEVTSASLTPLFERLNSHIEQLQKDNKSVEADRLIKAAEQLEKGLASLTTIKVEVGNTLDEKISNLAEELGKLELSPVINLPEPKVVINEKPTDTKKIEKSLDEVVTAVKAIKFEQQPVELEEVVDGLKDIKKAVRDLIKKPIPIPTFPFPFRNASNQGVQPLVDSDGHLQIDVLSGGEGTALATRIDDTSVANTAYIGKAPTGSSSAGSVWQIAKLDTSSGLIKTWADGSSAFNKIWDNRTSLTYQ